MARTELAVLIGVGLLALTCLVVCGVYVYWCSDGYRARKRRTDAQPDGARQPRRNHPPFSETEAIMGTQLSHRCKTSLYRVMFGHSHEESIVFLMAASREAAQKRATDALSVIHGIATEEVYLYNLSSFRELIENGVSEDEDTRIFELAWKGPNVSAWAEHPLFLTDDPSLMGKWAELYADLARELATIAINRARG
ncbi:hypothetical protein [Paraburkholderia sp.]|uniref:hypothetical protein n=1 Tax=Paraburkholderia sp. TaxID=1926495 RepID=UPI00238B6229|nr:hypothetical protein [Paraburkholderia sp.]MDE1179909.1 hypothetical protein [Paraburkholderia sp.]